MTFLLSQRLELLPTTRLSATGTTAVGPFRIAGARVTPVSREFVICLKLLDGAGAISGTYRFQAYTGPSTTKHFQTTWAAAGAGVWFLGDTYTASLSGALGTVVTVADNNPAPGDITVTTTGADPIVSDVLTGDTPQANCTWAAGGNATAFVVNEPYTAAGSGATGKVIAITDNNPAPGDIDVTHVVGTPLLVGDVITGVDSGAITGAIAAPTLLAGATTGAIAAPTVVWPDRQAIWDALVPTAGLTGEQLFCRGVQSPMSANILVNHMLDYLWFDVIAAGTVDADVSAELRWTGGR